MDSLEFEDPEYNEALERIPDYKFAEKRVVPGRALFKIASLLVLLCASAKVFENNTYSVIIFLWSVLVGYYLLIIQKSIWEISEGTILIKINSCILSVEHRALQARVDNSAELAFLECDILHRRVRDTKSELQKANNELQKANRKLQDTERELLRYKGLDEPESEPCYQDLHS